MKPYAFQQRVIDALPRALRRHHRVLVVSPTGSGKTVLGAAFVRTLPGRVLWLAHRNELLGQAQHRLAGYGVSAAIHNGETKAPPSARVVCASVQCRDLDPRAFDLIVVDEAHHVCAPSYARAMGDRPVLGLTATPARLDGKPLGSVFRHMIEAATYQELYALGLLVKPQLVSIQKDEAREITRGLPSSCGDYSRGEAAKRVKRLYGSLVRQYERHCPGERAIVYAVNVEHAQGLTRRFRRAGITAETIVGWTPDRAAIVDRFRSGETRVLVNCEVLTEGFDCPEASCVIVARPTRSQVLWRQMCGRGARVGSGYTVIDHAGNWHRLGWPDEPMVWSLEGRAKRSGSGETPGRRCDECGAVTREPGAEACSACGAAFPSVETEIIEDASIELERIERVKDLTGLRFGSWTVLERAENAKKRKLWLCRCDCGTESKVSGSKLIHGKSAKCPGCARASRFKNLKGQRFGNWTVLERAGSSKCFSAMWLCRCDCGKEHEVLGRSLTRGKSTKCRSCDYSSRVTIYEVAGVKLTGAQIAEDAGISVTAVRCRIKRGWTPEEIIRGRRDGA